MQLMNDPDQITLAKRSRLNLSYPVDDVFVPLEGNQRLSTSGIEHLGCSVVRASDEPRN